MKIYKKEEKPSFSDITSRQYIYLKAVIRELYNHESGVIDGSHLEADDLQLKEKQFTATVEYSNSILRNLAMNGILIPFDEKDIEGKTENDYTKVLWRVNLSTDENWANEEDLISFLSQPPDLTKDLVEASGTIWRELIYDDAIGNLRGVFSEKFNKPFVMNEDVRRVYWDLTCEYPPGQIYWLSWVAIRSNEEYYSDNFTDEFLRKRVLESINELKAKTRNGKLDPKFYDRSWKRPMCRFYKYWLVDVLSIKKEAFKKIPSKSLLLDWFDV